MKNLTFYLIVVILILGGSTYTFYYLNKENKANTKRMTENFYQTSKEQYQQFNLTVKEMKKSIDSKNDSILDAVGLKLRTVNQITNYNTYYTDTTISFILPEYEPKTGTYPFEDNQGCFEFSGFMEMQDTIPELTVENRKFNSDFTEIEYWERDTIHFLGMKAANYWRKPFLNYIVSDNCTGEKRIRKFNIKK